MRSVSLQRPGDGNMYSLKSRDMGSLCPQAYTKVTVRFMLFMMLFLVTLTK